MKSSQIADALDVAIRARRPAFIWGPPGVGKSQVVAQAAARRSLELRDLRTADRDPVDMRGLPTIDGDATRWTLPDFFPTSGAGILFLDEFPQAAPAVQNTLSQLILDRRLDGRMLPPEWYVVAAGNREADRAATYRMPTHLKNRFLHLDFDVDLDDWTTWALGAGIMPELVAFLRFRPALLHSFDPAKNERAFPTPRAWEITSDLLKQAPGPALEFDLIRGTVGEGAAAELAGFLRVMRDLPSVDFILMNPATAPVPADPAALYALAGALAHKSSDANFGRVLEYAGRLPVEFQVLTVRDATRKHPETQHTAAFIAWAAKNSNVLI